jgi:hypothetical protein
LLEGAGAHWIDGSRYGWQDLELRAGPIPTGVELTLSVNGVDAVAALRRNRVRPVSGPHYAMNDSGMVLRGAATFAELMNPSRLVAVLERFRESGKQAETPEEDEPAAEVALFGLQPAVAPAEAVQRALAGLVLLRDGAGGVPGRHHRLADDIWSLTVAQPADSLAAGDPADLARLATEEARLLLAVAANATAVRHVTALTITPTQRRQP